MYSENEAFVAPDPNDEGRGVGVPDDGELSFWGQNAEEMNRGCEIAKDLGLVDVGEGDPPKLADDGSLKTQAPRLWVDQTRKNAIELIQLIGLKIEFIKPRNRDVAAGYALRLAEFCWRLLGSRASTNEFKRSYNQLRHMYHQVLQHSE